MVKIGSKEFRQNDQMCKLEKVNETISCAEARKNSLNCLVKYATHEQKNKICQKFFDKYKDCIKSQAEQKKAARIAARGGSRW
jgi:hypothetical protein